MRKEETSLVKMADAHCHLDLFELPEKAIEEAMHNGVVIIITSGGSRNGNLGAWKMSRGLNVHGVVGIDPENANEEDTYLDDIKGMVESNSNIVGIGECGLDATVEDRAKKERQEEVFIAQIRLAKELDLPLVIHSRKRLERVIELLEQNRHTKVMFHHFEGDEMQAKALAAKGYLISIPPTETSRRRRIIKEIGLRNMVAETDSPVVGKTPADVSKVIKYIAGIKGLDFGEVAEITTENVRSFFNI